MQVGTFTEDNKFLKGIIHTQTFKHTFTIDKEIAFDIEKVQL